MGENILGVVKEGNEKRAIAFFLDYFCSVGGCYTNESDQLFTYGEKNRHIEYTENRLPKLICDIFGVIDQNDKDFIVKIVPEIFEQLVRWCRNNKRELTDRRVRDNWFIGNFSNGQYNVLLNTPYLYDGFVIKTSYINANYIAKQARAENDGGIRKFATQCSDDIAGQQRLLEAIAYAISDYRDNNRLFVFESDSDKPLWIIESLLKKVLEKKQLHNVPLHSILDNMNLNHVKVIISKSCKSNYEVDNNDKLSDILSGRAIPYYYEEKKSTIHYEIRNDLVVFHFKKLPTKFIESLTHENYSRISVIKIQSGESADWEEFESQILNGVDYCVSYLMDEILPELSERTFELTESDYSKQESSEDFVTLVKLFLNDRCDFGEFHYVSKPELHEAFVEFSGFKNRNTFYEVLDKQYESGKKDSKHVYKGLKLRY
jgi:hypothetical protein